MVVVNFVLAHQAFFYTLAGLLLQEFIANSKLVSNSLGQLVFTYVKNLIAEKQAAIAPASASQGK